VAEGRPSGRYSARDRVRKRTEFLRIQQGGRRVVSPGFVFMLQRSADGQGPRLGITASRRVGNAVERNRAKRLVREAFRAVRSSWPAADVVVIVRQGLGSRKLDDVVAEWQAARSRIVRRFAELSAASAPSVSESSLTDRGSKGGRSTTPLSKDAGSPTGGPAVESPADEGSLEAGREG
jgi:ribonuclease P protein component